MQPASGRLLLAALLLAGLSAVVTGALPAATSSDAAVSQGAILFVGSRTVDSLFLVNANGTGLRSLLDNAVQPQWSPDGRRIAFKLANASSGYGIYVVNADGTGQKRLPTGGAGEFTWSPDGRRIAYRDFGDPFRIAVIRVDGGAPQRVTDGGEKGDADPAWSPDGSTIAFIRGEPDPSGGSGFIDSLYVIKPDGSGLRQLRRDIEGFAWAPDGKEIAFGQRAGDSLLDDLYVIRLDGTGTRKISTRPLRIDSLAWSPRGDRIAVKAEANLDANADSLFVLGNDGGVIRKVADGVSGRFEWSPDGSQLVFAGGEPSDLWVVAAAGGPPRRITQGYRYGYENGDPHWHPKGLRAEQLGGTPVSPSIPTDSVVVGGTLQATSAIEQLATDGTRAAAAYASGVNCLELWELPKALTRFSEGACGAGPPGLLELTLAGARTAWLTYDQGNHLYLDVLTATPSHQRPVDAMSIATGGNISCSGRFCGYAGIGDLRGHGSLLVFDTWAQKGGPCEVVECFRKDKTQGVLWRLVGNRALKIRSEGVGLSALAVDQNRIAVARSDGPVEIVGANGSLLRTFRFRQGEVHGAALSGQQLVVQKAESVVVYDVQTGTLGHMWPLAGGARLEDAQRGIAVYVSGTAVHLLRLSDGRDAVIRVPGKGPVQAQIEAAGLFYSYAVLGSQRPGRIVFASFKNLLRQFR
jgi:Tol biopolymer transport system component